MISMGLYGISKLYILSGILLFLQIGAADKPAKSSDSAWSSTTALRQEALQGASAIHTATHLFSQKTQSSSRGDEHVPPNDEISQTIDNDRLKQLQDVISDIYHKKTSVSTAATPKDLLTELPRYTTTETSSSKEYVTETDVRAKFGTTSNVDSLTKVNTNLHTTTSSDTLTEGHHEYLLSTAKSEDDVLTESPSFTSPGLTTEQAETFTVSSATQQPKAENLATEAALKSRTTAPIYSESITEGAEKTKKSTVVSTARESVTIADTTNSDGLQSEFNIDQTSRTEESRKKGDEVFTTRDETLFDSTTLPSVVGLVLPVGDVSSHGENNANGVDEDGKNALKVIQRPIPATDGPSSAHNIGDMPYQSRTTPGVISNVAEEDEKVLSWDLPRKMTRKEKEGEKTTSSEMSDNVVTVISMTTDEVDTVKSFTEPDVKVATTRVSESTTAETLEEKLSGFFRCTDGTLIDIASHCDKKADCPDYSDEDSCNADEKASLTEEVHRPLLNWKDDVSKGSRDDVLISLGDSKAGVVEMEQSRTEAPTTFRCEEGGNIIPITALCDKRADCLDYSDEYNCDGNKHVMEATTTVETTTKQFMAETKFDNTPAIELLNEENEEAEFFRCLDGSAVVPMRAVCDNKWDCLDFSDEDECDSKGKLPVVKANKTKPGISWATPKTPADLPDRNQNMAVQELSDEKGALPEYWRCENGNYIFISSVCDKKDDCGDFSDEDDCKGNRKVPVTEAPDVQVATTTSPLSNLSESGTLAMTTHISTTVQSTAASLTLFQVDDVKSWTQGVTPSMDIVEETYPVAMFQCDDGQEIEAVKVCDRNVDCYDGSDEDDCYDWMDEPSERLRFAREAGSGTGPTPIVCGEGCFQCDDLTCINETLTCNGINDCSTGEDEDTTTICMGACQFPTLNSRVVLATGTPAQSLYQNGTVLTLDCILGSTLMGDSSITCLDGSFSTGPMCLRNCHIDLGRTALTCSSDTYVHGSNPDCNCDSGYNLEVENVNITCTDSLFLPQHPQCEETNECLMTVTPCDQLAECFNMPLGSFTCICNAGYTGNGTYCEDIDECSLSIDTCDENATCTNTAGSYTCACDSGFLGDGMTCIEQIYYNFGTAAGDSDITATSGFSTGNGYSVSGAIMRRQYVPIGDQLFNYIFITNTGAIAFSNEPSVDLTEFSHPSPFTSNTSSMPAVYDFGIEARTDQADSGVFFQIYENTATDDYTMQLLANVSSQVNSAGLGSNFVAEWAMVVTWYNARRFGTDAQSTETDTFQAVLTTDGSHTYIVQLYQENSMLWDADQLAIDEVPVIGYRTSSDFYDLQSSRSLTRSMMFRPDDLTGNIVTDGLANFGQFVFRLDTNSDSFINPAKFCQDWYDSSSQLNTLGAIPCPCTRQQASNDFRFMRCLPYTTLADYPSIEPFPSELENSRRCRQQRFTAFFSTVGSRCIYSQNGSLVVGYDSMWESSHVQSVLARPRISPSSLRYRDWIDEDVLPRHYCCSQLPNVEFCNMYKEKRPERTCSGYFAITQAWGRGDPHINTLDMLSYTFNGLGEYWLIRIDSAGFQLQGRTERTFNDTGAEVDSGTVFTSFVTSQGDTTVQFDLNADRTAISILVNGSETVDLTTLQTSGYDSSDPLFDLEYQSSQDRYSASFSNNDAIIMSFSVGLSQHMLDLLVQLPNEYRDGRTRGLYGVADGDPNNDMTFPNNTVVADPETQSEMVIFEYGESWRVDVADTLFTYMNSDTWNTYNGNSFVPQFLSTLMQSANADFLSAALGNCSGDSSCIFDALATNDIAIGTNTMMIGMERMQEVEELENFPPILNNLTEVNPDADYPAINADGVITVIVNRSYTFQATAVDQNGDAVTYSLVGNIPSSASIDSSSGIFTWTPANTDPVQITIEASDGTVSRDLQLLIVVCGCQNNGTCIFSTIMEGNNLNNDKFAVAQCMCIANGYAGPFCENDKDSCEFDTCYPGVTCIDEPPPSETARCADCPPNLTGDGFQCSDLDECTAMVDECGDLALCQNIVGSYECFCDTGYDLQPNLRDCIDVNECDRGIDICDENSVCINNAGSYTCECNDGYVLQSDNRTCSDVDECDNMPCGLHADCGNVVGSFTCTCRSGYQGDGRSDCADYNECFNPDDNDCSQFASCENVPGYYVCTCLLGYEGSGLNCTDRDECEEGVAQCSPFAACTNVEGSFMCNCDSGFTGDGNTCVDVNECLDPSANNCDENALCTNSEGSFSCACNEGFEGNGTHCQDINECIAGTPPCDASAACTNTIGTYTCSCFDGYSGDGFSCSDIDECVQQIDNCTQVCNNNVGSYSCACNPGFILDADNFTCNVAVGEACDVALNPCTGVATCINATGLINCTCARGFTLFNLTHCQDIDECADTGDNNCDISVGTCSNKEGGYTCSCANGYQLAADERTCLDINECETGSNNCSADAVCNNFAGTYNCTCNAGYSGDGVNCTNINECDGSPCGMNSDCTDTVGSYMCQCSVGYVDEGNLGCQDMDECVGMPCDANGNCTNTEGSYICTCLAGFVGNGTYCEDIKECDDPNRCVANSQCMELEGSYTCICNTGYRGDGTEDCVDVDECVEDPTICHRRANCNNTEGSYICTCNAGYTGDGQNCTNINECELGNIDCDVNSNCSDTDGSYTCSCITGYFDSTGGRAAAGECEDVDECAFEVDDCDANSMCLNNNGSYTCICNDGYMSVTRTTCTDILECSQNPNPCNTAGFEVCKELEGSYECICQPSTYRVNGVCTMTTTLFLTVEFEDIQGLVVEFHYDTINNEADRQGLANDTWAVLMNSDMFSDVLDVSIQSMTLLDNGIVAKVIFRVDVPINNNSTENDLAIVFNDGLIGSDSDILAPDNRVYVLTEIDVDDNECKNFTICPKLAMCINTVGSFSCKCQEGYVFTDNNNNTCGDLDECAQNICSVNSNCTNSIGSFACECNDGFTGDGITCDDIDECQTEDICGNNTDCTNIPGSYECSCAIGFDGTPPSCQDIDECSADNTNNCTQNCTNNVGSYDCSCGVGYVLDGGGFICNDIDECVTANDCGSNSMCNNTVGSYICTCDSGYRGSPPGSACQNIDECADQTDQCSQNCMDTAGSYECTCNPGFDLDVDGFTCNVAPGMACNAALDPCTGGGVCVNASNLINCTCPRGFFNYNDTHCQDEDECTDMTDNCDSAVGSCSNTPGSYNCSCPNGFMLQTDQRTCTDIDECQEMTDNCDDAGGICTNTIGSFNCSCLDGYSLQSDQATCTDIDECSVANPCTLANEECQNMPGSYQCVCAEGFTRTSGYCLTNMTITGSISINLVNNLIAAYTDSLADPTSQEYMDLANLVCAAFLNEIDNMVNMSTPYPIATCEVTGFAPGSFSETIVSFVLTVYGETATEVANVTTDIMNNGFSGPPRVWTDENGNTIQLTSLFFQDAAECALPTSCSGVNEGCTELNPGFECFCSGGSSRFMGICLYKVTLTGSFRYNRVNGMAVTYRDTLGDSSSNDFSNEVNITCGVFLDQIQEWVNASVAYLYLDCNITGFRPGSIIVDFSIDIYGTSQMEAMMRAQIASDNGFQDSPSNWTGDSDIIYVEELTYSTCESSSCQNGGTCHYNTTTDTISCLCLPGYGGAMCENKVACNDFTCLNGGTCQVDILGDPYCDCPVEYTGTFCETPVSCEELDCQNNSTCEVDSNGVASCICLDGYEGERCQLESTPGLSTGVIVGIVLGVVGFVLLVVVLCFCCLILFAARRRRERKRELLEGADNWGYGGRRYVPAAAAPSAISGPSRGAVVRNDPAEFSSESSDNFYYYQNTRGRALGAAGASAPSARPIYTVDDDDDDDTIDSRFSGIIRNMWNMHADQRPEASFDPRDLPSASNFMAGGIPRASVQPRHLYPEYNNAGFERPYVADGTESYQYSEETEDFRPYRGRNRDKSRGAMDAFNYF